MNMSVRSLHMNRCILPADGTDAILLQKRRHGMFCRGKAGGMRMAAAIGSALFLVLAPGTVAGAIPWTITRWAASSPDWPQMTVSPLSALLIGFGLIVLLDSFSRFALQGSGTPTPLLPTNQLIVTGLYRHVRNPMYVAVLSLISGQAILFGTTWLVVYGLAVWAIFHMSVVFYEEPRLLAEYDEAFVTYRRHVPRWLPRLKPWQEGEASASFSSGQ